MHDSNLLGESTKVKRPEKIDISPAPDTLAGLHLPPLSGPIPPKSPSSVEPAPTVSEDERPTCSAHGQQYMTGVCSHGNKVVKPLACNRRDCQDCTRRRMSRYRREIHEGIKQQPDNDYVFVTLTQCRHTNWTEGMDACPMCKVESASLLRACPSSLLQSLKRFRKAYNASRRLAGTLRFYRVVEVHKDGKAHLHLIVDRTQAPDFVDIPRPHKGGESIRSYHGRLDDRQRALIGLLMRHGFGPIANVEAVQETKAAASYLTNYITKLDADALGLLLHASGRSIRVCEGSRDWNPKEAEQSTYEAALSFERTDGSFVEDCPCPKCDQENADEDPNHKAHYTRARVERWLADLAPDSDARRKLATDWDAYCTDYERATDKLSDARRRFDLASVLLITPDNLEELEWDFREASRDFKEKCENRERFLRSLLDRFRVPVSVLHHLRREHRPLLEPVPF